MTNPAQINRLWTGNASCFIQLFYFKSYILIMRMKIGDLFLIFNFCFFVSLREFLRSEYIMNNNYEKNKHSCYYLKYHLVLVIKYRKSCN